MFKLFVLIAPNYSNLLLMVNKSNKIEIEERIKPDIIKGLDLWFSFLLWGFLEKDKFLFFL